MCVEKYMKSVEMYVGVVILASVPWDALVVNYHPAEIHRRTHKPLDSLPRLLYNTEELTTTPMNTSHAEKQQIRVTLDFDVYADFDVHQIDFHKVFDIQGGENLTVTVEDLSEEVEELWEAAYH